RLVAESLFRNGALQEAVFSTTSGRWNGFNQRERSLAEISGPRKLNLASLPSNVPCPISTSHSGPNPSFGSAAKVSFSNSKSFVSPGGARPNLITVQLLWVQAASQRVAWCTKLLPNSALPGAPTTRITVVRSAESGDDADT